jgi:hypothetical protein
VPCGLEGMEQFTKSMRELARGLERVAEAAEGEESRPGVNVNVQRRVNAKVVVNRGRSGSVTKASAKQHAPIRQRSGKDDA